MNYLLHILNNCLLFVNSETMKLDELWILPFINNMFYKMLWKIQIIHKFKAQYFVENIWVKCNINQRKGCDCVRKSGILYFLLDKKKKKKAENIQLKITLLREEFMNIHEVKEEAVCRK